MLTGNEIYETTKYQIKGISWKLRTASTTNFQPSNVNIKTASHEKEEEKSEKKRKKKKKKNRAPVYHFNIPYLKITGERVGFCNLRPKKRVYFFRYFAV